MSASGGATANYARSHGNPSNECSCGNQASQTKLANLHAQVERLADVYFVRVGVCGIRALCTQIANDGRHLCGRLVALSILGFALVGSSANAAERLTDITLRTGIQLKEQIGQLSKKYPDIDVGLKYFADQKLSPESEGLTELDFRAGKKPEYYSLLFIPVSEESPTAQAGQPNNLHLELSAISPKGARVLLGTVSSDGKQVEVRDEKQVVAGKVEPSKDYLKRFFKCTAEGCIGAAGCLVSGPAAIPCFCLSCGAVIGGCSLFEYFFP
jgi:hypothetical protein